MKKVLILIFIILNSCTNHEIRIDSLEKEKFLNSKDIGLYQDGIGLFIFDENSHQYAVNYKRNIFRFQDDTQSFFVNIELENSPQNVGVNIILNLTIMDNSEISSSMQLFECSKLNTEYFWFWNSDSKVGIIIPAI